MPEQREVVTLSGERRVITDADKKKAADVAAKLTRAEKKARFVRVLERGFTIDRLTVELPDHLYGEWVPQDQIERWQTLGFEDGTEYAAKRGLHDKGRIADCVFMVQPREDHELYEEVRRELFIQQHGSPDEKRRLQQKEEKEFANLVETQAGLPVVDESVEHEARRSEIKEAIAAKTPTVGNLNQ
jgi:hypothetical protein